MLFGRKCCLMVFMVLALAQTVWAEPLKVDFGKPSPVMRVPWFLKKAELVPLWKREVEQLERQGDFNGACSLLKEHYLQSIEVEVGDHFSRLLSHLTDDQLADRWQRESNEGLSCRIAVEFFSRLSHQPAIGLPAASEQLLLDLALKLTSGCKVSEKIKTEAQDFLLLHQVLAGATEVTVGCLLPLSGSNAAAGEHLLRGMELALGVYPEVIVKASPESETISSEGSELSLAAKNIKARKKSSTSEVVDTSTWFETVAEPDAGVTLLQEHIDTWDMSMKVKSLVESVVDTAASNPLAAPKSQTLPRLRLLIYDTAGEGERARAGVRYLVNKKKVNLLIGPYTGKAANYAAVEAHSRGVTMVSLSPLLHNLERYPNVFQHYPTIRNQAVSLADLAMTRMGLKDFAMLVPKNRYGREFAEVFAAQAEAWGGQVIRKVYYDSSRPDFGPAIREMIGPKRYSRFKVKRHEYEVWLKYHNSSMGKDKLSRLAREIGLNGAGLNLYSGKNKVMPRPLLDCDFEAIVVPDRALSLQLLIPQLAFYDLEECWLLGGRYWNSEALLAKVGEYAEGALMVDGSCAHCDASAELVAFRERFSALNQGEVPGLLETYGFDTIMLLRQLCAKMGPEPDAEIWRRALVGCRDLPLASGITTTLGDGEIAKQLYPLTFRKGHIEMVDESCY